VSLKEWQEYGWLRPHQTSPQEIQDLLNIVDRDLRDARSNASADWRFGIAYNAALKCCTILLHTSGYRAVAAQAHQRTIQALPVILGDRWKNEEAYLNNCRSKRNTVEYEMAGIATENDVKELIDFAGKLKLAALDWLKEHHSSLLKSKKPSKRGKK
jgi:hypothetical protein